MKEKELEEILADLDEEEAVILDTPVEFIPPEIAFQPVPLVARMSKGVENVR